MNVVKQKTKQNKTQTNDEQKYARIGKIGIF